VRPCPGRRHFLEQRLRASFGLGSIFFSSARALTLSLTSDRHRARRLPPHCQRAPRSLAVSEKCRREENHMLPQSASFHSHWWTGSLRLSVLGNWVMQPQSRIDGLCERRAVRIIAIWTVKLAVPRRQSCRWRHSGGKIQDCFLSSHNSCEAQGGPIFFAVYRLRSTIGARGSFRENRFSFAWPTSSRSARFQPRESSRLSLPGRVAQMNFLHHPEVLAIEVPGRYAQDCPSAPHHPALFFGSEFSSDNPPSLPACDVSCDAGAMLRCSSAESEQGRHS